MRRRRGVDDDDEPGLIEPATLRRMVEELAAQLGAELAAELAADL